MYLDDDCTFDSLNSPDRMMINQALETAIACQLDNIHSNMQANEFIHHYQQQAIHAQNALLELEARQEQQQKRKEQRQREVYDSMICQSVPFSEIESQWDSFMAMGTSDKDTLPHNPKKAQEQRVSIFDRMRGVG